MKKTYSILLSLVFLIGLLSSCHRPECKTKAGKKKIKHYKSLQYR